MRILSGKRLLGCLIALAPLVSAESQIVVLRAKGPSREVFPAGRILPASYVLDLKQGDMLTVLDGEGSRIVKGVLKGPAGKRHNPHESSWGDTIRELFKERQPRVYFAEGRLATNEELAGFTFKRSPPSTRLSVTKGFSSDRRARIGAVRPATVKASPFTPAPAGDLWQIDLEDSTDYCAPSVADIRFGPSAFINVMSGEWRQLNLRSKDGSQKFPLGSVGSTWPTELRVKSGDVFDVYSGDARVGRFGVTLIDSGTSGTDSLIVTLLKANCVAQARMLLAAASEGQEADPAQKPPIP